MTSSFLKEENNKEEKKMGVDYMIIKMRKDNLLSGKVSRYYTIEADEPMGGAYMALMRRKGEPVKYPKDKEVEDWFNSDNRRVENRWPFTLDDVEEAISRLTELDRQVKAMPYENKHGGADIWYDDTIPDGYDYSEVLKEEEEYSIWVYGDSKEACEIYKTVWEVLGCHTKRFVFPWVEGIRDNERGVACLIGRLADIREEMLMSKDDVVYMFQWF